MHGGLSETALLVLAIEESLLIRGRCYPTHPISMGPFCSRADPKGARNRPTGRYARRPLLATAGSRLRFRCDSRHFGRLIYCYLRTTTKAMARLYRVIVLSEDRIPQTEGSDHTLVYS